MATCTIPMTHKGKVLEVLVDEADYKTLSQHRWCCVNGYAARRGETTIYMHRQLMGLKPGDGQQVDHRNRNGLDNRRSNLRIATHALNRHNLPSYRGGTSRYRGVSWSKLHKQWRATVQLHGKVNHVGLYKREEDAAKAAAAYRAEHMSHALD